MAAMVFLRFYDWFSSFNGVCVGIIFNQVIIELSCPHFGKLHWSLLRYTENYVNS